MKAVVAHEFGEATVEEVPRPDPGEDEVIVEISRVQLSVTDAWTYRGELDRPVHDAVTRRIEGGEGQIFGHEFSGTVVEVGPGVEEFTTGDRVYPPGKIACGSCPYCERGYKEYCEHKETIGFERQGALAEYVAVPTEVLCKLPDDVSDAEGAALQPAAAALVCAHDADIQSGDIVATVGMGVMGTAAAQFAVHHGADTVVASDVVPEKLALADDYGLVGIDATETDPVEEVRNMTGGVGADVVFEAVGGEQSHGTDGSDPLAQATRMVRRGGTVVQIGIMPSEITVDPRVVRGKCVTWRNPRDPAGVLSIGPNGNTGRAAAKMAADGRLVVDDYITHELSGLDAFHEAVEMTLNKAEHGALGPPQIIL